MCNVTHEKTIKYLESCKFCILFKLNIYMGKGKCSLKVLTGMIGLYERHIRYDITENSVFLNYLNSSEK